MLHLERNFVWFGSLGTSESRSEILENFEMWCWRMEKSIWTDRVEMKKYSTGSRKEEISYITVRIKKASWIDHILCRNCLLKMLLKERKR